MTNCDLTDDIIEAADGKSAINFSILLGKMKWLCRSMATDREKVIVGICDEATSCLAEHHDKGSSEREVSEYIDDLLDRLTKTIASWAAEVAAA